MALVRIQGGRVYDPRHGVDGDVRDVWVRDGVVVDAPGEGAKAELTVDARGCVVMPGGIDMHCHIAGSKVNVARKILPESARNGRAIERREGFRSGTGGAVPSTFATGYLYAGLGYTSAVDAAVPALMARHAHEEFRDTPILDKAFLVMMGNHQYVFEALAADDPARVQAFMGWLLNATKGAGVKIVNPGGVEMWKRGGRNVHGLDDPLDGYGISPRTIVRSLADAADGLKLPHPVHIHCNDLGIPGNWETTLATMQSLEGRRGHFTHIQFHSYGGTVEDQGTFCSQVPVLADYVNTHPNLTVDVGQVMFGETVSMTGDSAVGYFLHKLTGRKWFSSDTEVEGGCGIVPITYRDKSFVHALQWAIGLEWYLLVNDPWRIAMSTDHPNGASFLAYPEIIALLMDRNRRLAQLERLPAGIRERCSLFDLNREYTLGEIAIITRAAPAKMLGWDHKGHLGPGADGDVTIYQPNDDYQRMFEFPRYVLKRGEVIVDGGELRGAPDGETVTLTRAFEEDRLNRLGAWFEDHYSIRIANYPVRREELDQVRFL